MKSSKLFAILAVALAACSPGMRETASDSGSDADSSASAPAPAPRRDSITLALTGDVMMGTTFPDSVNGTHLPAEGGKHLFADAAPILRRAGVAAGNLEGTLLDGPGERRKPGKNPRTYFVFRMPTSMAANLADAGYDFMGVATNHINDFGPSGRASTLSTLNDYGIAAAGLKGCAESAVIERAGFRIGLTQFGHSANTLQNTDLADLRRIVKDLRSRADIVVVSFHGGAEGAACLHVPHEAEYYLGEARGDVEKFAHAAIDAGADVVFGHGPHVPRAAELYRGHIIFYSLGNFCTPFRMGLSGATGYAPIAEVTIDSEGRFLRGKIHSLIQRHGTGPRLDPEHSAAALIRRLSLEDFPSSPLRISPEGEITVK